MTSTPGRFVPGIDPASVTAVPLDGERVTGTASSEVHAPYDGALLGSVPSLTADDVDRAVAAAKRALHEDPLPQWRRAEILDKAALLLAERQEDFARCIALEAAKPIRTARAEAQRAVSTLQFSAAVARSLAGEVVPLEASAAGEGKLGFILRVPIGVVGAIAPFNFPLNLVAHKLGPAIAAGCPVVLKPASQTPFSSILLARLLLEECGLPAGYLHVVTGSAARSWATRSSTTTTSRSSPSPDRRRSAGASGRAHRASGSGSSSATTRRSSSRPTATGARPWRR